MEGLLLSELVLVGHLHVLGREVGNLMDEVSHKVSQTEADHDTPKQLQVLPA